MTDRPNIVLCICDQLRAFEVGCYGNGHIRTPHIDGLAAEGVRFDTAVTNNPVCMPARSCLLSGQYSRTCMGSVNNRFERDANGQWTMPQYPVADRVHFDSPTLAERLRALGYDTALIGKWHVHPQPGLLGFDYSLYPLAHHRYTGQTYIENSGAGEVVDDFGPHFESECIGRYLRNPARRKRPFFLYYSISPPHMPLNDAPERYINMYSAETVPLRPNVVVNGAMAHDEDWFRVYLWDFLFYQDRLPHTLQLPDGFDLGQLTALYYGMTTWVDDMMGRLLASIDSAGLTDNTIIVFLSDHGDNLGSHHLFGKGRLIQESVRIPLIFCAPFAWTKKVVSGHVAQIIDIMPTLLELCGDVVPESVQGRSLVSLFSHQRDVLQESDAFIETGGGMIGLRTPTHLYGVGLDRARQVMNDRDCFFDLTADPYEQNNLAATDVQSELARRLRGRLADWNQSTPVLRPGAAGARVR